MVEIRITHKYDDIIALPNLLAAWKEFIRGKKHRADIRQFSQALFYNICQLQQELESFSYHHSAYDAFTVYDPKRRSIHKATVRDRIFHQAIYQKLYPAFDRTFIFDSYSCRNNKGTHKAFARLVAFSREVNLDCAGRCWAIKMDIKKFFDSVDHRILIGLLTERITDKKLLRALRTIISSFEFSPGKGMPLGNLTSQLFANIYLDPLDKFVKQTLKAKYYLRYADDFMILSPDPEELLGYFVEINTFLKNRLRLQLHPDKIVLRKLLQGIDFVGYVAFPHHQLPRRKTVRRIIKKASIAPKEQLQKALLSYLGYLQHASSHKIQQQLKEITQFPV